MGRSAVLAAVVVLAACGEGSAPTAAPADPSQASEARERDATAATGPDAASGPDAAVPGEPAPVGAGPADAGPADPDPPAEPSVAVEVEPPPGWKRTDEPHLVAASGGDGAVYLNEAACHEGFCAHLHVAAIPGAVRSLEAYHLRSLQEVAEVLDAEVVAEEPARVDGHRAHQMIYRVDDAEGALRYLQRYALVDEQIVVATFVATPALFDEWRGDAETLLTSVTVTSDE